ncbi:MAG: threonine ammonia-lyase [Halanaerobiaceae bacterium]
MELSKVLNSAKLEQIHSKIKDKIIQTPCIYSEFLSSRYGHDIYLKLENLQKTGAFKIRGNSYKLSRMENSELKNGVVTASSGNHGLGLSLAASLKGIRAEIFVPQQTPENKIEKIKSYGAEVTIKGENYDRAVEYAKAKARDEDLTYIPSFDDRDIIKGNTTLGYEIFTRVKNPARILVPVGGGGGISGISIARDKMSPQTEIVGVEAVGAASMKGSIERGKRIKLEKVSTLADGIKVAQPGKLTYEIVKRKVAEIKTVSEAEMKKVFRELLLKAGIVVELAATASVAALDKIDFTAIDKPLVCVVTGGNIDKDLILDILKED